MIQLTLFWIYIQKEMRTRHWIDIYTPMYTATLFTIAKIWKQSNFLVDVVYIQRNIIWPWEKRLKEVLPLQVGNSQSWKARGKLGPRDSILYRRASRLPVANQVFLGSWTVDIRQAGCSQRSAPQRRHMAYLRWHFHCAPRKMIGWDGGGDKMRRPPGECALAKHLVVSAART